MLENRYKHHSQIARKNFISLLLKVVEKASNFIALIFVDKFVKDYSLSVLKHNQWFS